MCSLYHTCSRLPVTQGGVVCTTVCVTLPRPDCLNTIESMYLPTATHLQHSVAHQHPPTVYAESVQLCICPHCRCHVSTHTMYVCMYVCMCLCSSVTCDIVFKQFVQASSTLWHTYSTCEHTVRDTVSTSKPVHHQPSKEAEAATQHTSVDRQVVNMSSLLVLSYILPKVSKWTVPTVT